MVPAKSELSQERALYEALDFFILDSGLKSTVEVTSHTQLNSVASIPHFIASQSQCARVIVCSDEEVVREGVVANIHLNLTDKAIIENLTKNDVVYLTKDEMLRGFNFRLKDVQSALAISLLLCRPMAHERALKQCLGRVGRCGELAHRFRVEPLTEVVDRTTALTMAGRIKDRITKATG